MSTSSTYDIVTVAGPAAERGDGWTRPSTSVIVCAYTERRWEALCEAVEAAGAQGPDEVIVVIDHNDALHRRTRLRFPTARVLANAGPRGLSGARNSGVEQATGEVLVFLDDDARPRPGWLSQMVGAFADDDVIGAGGVAVPRWQGPAPAWIPEEFLWVVGCSYRGVPTEQVEIRNPIGATMAFRREVFARIGGFTDGVGRVGRTPLGCEETELSIRAVSSIGGRIVHVPESEVDHLVSSDRTRRSYFRRRCWAEGLSKAIVARLVGSGPALQSERGYVLRTLPAGVARGLLDAARGDGSGLARSGAIAAGLAITVAGYARGRLATGWVR